LQSSNYIRKIWFLLLLLPLAFYLYGLSSVPFLGPDEPRYAQIAREMLNRGDLITPTLHGYGWFEKPALLYWVVVSSYKLLGVSEFAARLGSALAGILSILSIALLGWQLERSSKGELSGLGFSASIVLASSVGLIAFSRSTSFDIYITSTLTLTLAAFLASEVEESSSRRKQLLLTIFYIGIGLSLLAKGLIGIVIPVLIVGSYLLLQRRWPSIKELGLLWGVPLALLVALTWYGPMTLYHGWKFIDDFFIQHHFARYVSNKYKHPQPFYFYIPIILLLQFPWTTFLISSLLNLKEWKLQGSEPITRFRLFALCWTIVPIAFFSLSGSKLPGYILPALPGASLLVGEEIRRYIFAEDRHRQLAMKTGQILLLLIGILGMVYFSIKYKDISGYIVIVFIPFIAAGSFGLLTKASKSLQVISIFCAIFLTSALFMNGLLGRVVKRESIKDLITLAAERGYRNNPILFMYNQSRTAEFYAEDRLEYISNSDPVVYNDPRDVHVKAKEYGGSVLVVISVNTLQLLTNYPGVETQVLGDNERSAIVAVRSR
jgi:4-amino-4-deoxy-L-arabinose transferase-like glycosyltransferase